MAESKPVTPIYLQVWRSAEEKLPGTQAHSSQDWCRHCHQTMAGLKKNELQWQMTTLQELSSFLVYIVANAWGHPFRWELWVFLFCFLFLSNFYFKQTFAFLVAALEISCKMQEYWVEQLCKRSTVPLLQLVCWAVLDEQLLFCGTFIMLWLEGAASFILFYVLTRAPSRFCSI